MSHPAQHACDARSTCEVIGQAVLRGPIVRRPHALRRIVLTNRGIQPPFRRDSLQKVCAAVFKRDTGSVHEVFHRARYEYFPGLCLRDDAGTDVDGDSTDVVAPQFAFAAVQSAPDLDPEFWHPLGERGGAPDRSCRSVESDQEPVAGVFDLAALESRDFLAGDVVVAPEQLPPLAIADFGCAPCRVHDVREHDRGQNPVRGMLVSMPGEELLDLIDDRLCVTDGRPVVDTVEFHKARRGDFLGDLPPEFDRDCLVFAVQNQRRHRNTSEDVLDLGLG
jgi:hypothetical protein